MPEERGEGKFSGKFVIILIVILLIIGAIVGLFFLREKLSNDGSENVDKYQADLMIENVEVLNESGIRVKINNPESEEDIDSVIFIFYDDNGNKIITRKISIEELEGNNFQVEFSFSDVSDVEKISVTPRFTSESGKSINGKVEDEYQITGNEEIPEEEIPECGSDLECDDHNACTINDCLSRRICTYTSIENCVPCEENYQCDDSNACTTGKCLEGKCTYLLIPKCTSCYSALQCEDNNSCTENICFSGRCIFNPISNCSLIINNQTNTTNQSNTNPIINITPQCTNSTQCNDYISCTRDTCSGSKCVYTNITSCVSGDGCCPTERGCTFTNDNDCLPVCGNNIREGTEQCDGTYLGGATCAGVRGAGYTGTLLCSNCLYNSSLCVAPCTQTCQSLGYTCGMKTICGSVVNCGNCLNGFNCESNGTCIKSSGTTNPNPNITNPTGDYWSYRKQLQRTTNLFSNSNVPNGAAWMHFQRGTYDSSSSRLYDSSVSYQNDGTGSIRLFYGGNEQAYDRIVSRQGIPVTPGETYTFSVMTKTESWPPAVFYLDVFVTDSNGNWISNSIVKTGGVASNTKPGIWEESSIFFTPKPGTNYIGVSIGVHYEQQVEGIDRAEWFDDFYVGKGRGFKEPYEEKLAFNGSVTRVDDLGNIYVLKNGQWTPFFPLAIFAHGTRPDWSIYSRQGFNMNIWAVDAYQVQKAKLATSDFNPDGMLSGFSTSQYLQPYAWAYNDTEHMLDFINDLKSQGLMDEIVFYFQDNERIHGSWYTPEIFARIVTTNDVDSQGKRMHPIYQLNGHPGVARKFNSERANIADITGNYVGLGELGTGGGTNGFVLLDNYPGQRMPVSMAQMNTMGLEFRPSLYGAIAHGAKGMGYYWDNYPVPAERVENSPWWNDLPNIRREIDALMPLIVQPHWTDWTVDVTTNSFVDYGTRMLNGEGYIIVANYESSPSTITFTLNNLPYTPIRLENYFTGAQVTTISNSRFTLTIPAYGSGVYKIADSKTTTSTCTGSSSQSCSITNGAGSQSRTCNNGIWSAWGTCTVTSCNLGYIQSGNSCIASCTNDCSPLGTKQCSGSGYILCGNYDTTDTCLEWSGIITCSSGSCSGGECVTIPVQASQIIADHTIVDRYDDIPQCYIDKVKTMWVSFPGESHSESIRRGVELLEARDSRYQVTVRLSGTPDPSTTNYLRLSSATWGDINNPTGWRYSYGEEDWWTSTAARTRTKAGIVYANSNGLSLSAIGLAWCWDMQAHPAVGSETNVDPVYGVHWYGSSVGSPAGSVGWGLDDNDNSLSTKGQTVNLDTYLSATEEYRLYALSQGYPTKILFTTGTVDSIFAGEKGYQGYLKNERIRTYVRANKDRILFDYGDILSYNDDGSSNFYTWNGHSYPLITSRNLGDESIGHIGQEGAVRLAKAMWWTMARIAGWDGISTSCS